MKTDLFIGLISGTSMDGIDCALVDLSGDHPQVEDFICADIPSQLKEAVTALIANDAIDLRDLGSADVALGKLFAETALSLLAKNKLPKERIDAIGSHGQTIWHQPSLDSRASNRFTLQIGDPNTIAELTGITTVADFRRRDMTAGGQGAPLVPALHRAVFASSHLPRVVLNLGGFANITVLPVGQVPPFGYDTGPANILMDSWIQHSKGISYDENGLWASSGRCDQALLHRMLDDPYFTSPHPKSTGREMFNLEWLQKHLHALGYPLRAEDVQSTLLELTAETIARAIKQHIQAGEVLACGGGVRNAALMQLLQKKLFNFKVGSTSEHGLHADCVEAAAFAWFAQQTLQGSPIDFSPFTGASGPVIAGAIYKAQR